MAVALVNHGVKISDFTEEAIRNDKVLEVAAKVHVVADAKMERGAGRGISPSRVTVRTGGGRIYSAEASIPKGHPQNSMTEEEFREKFRDCAAHAINPLPEERVERVIKALSGLENIENVADILQLLVKPV